LKKAQVYGHNLDVWRRTLDMRKIPGIIRQRSRIVAWNKIAGQWSKWEAWILGEGDKPP